MTPNKLKTASRPPSSTRLLEKLLFPSRALATKELRQLANVIAGKTILITGASYGIGEQLAYLLARATVLDSLTQPDSLATPDNLVTPDNKHTKTQVPAQLILVGRTTQKLAQVQAHIQQMGGAAIIYPLDLRDDEQLQGFISYLQTLSVDMFINNAGKSIKRAIMDSLERSHDAERTISLNYLAPVKLCLSLIPKLKANQGHIINVSALNVLLPPMPEWSAYQASKSAFDQWLRAAAPELYANGITTSTLYLPLVRTRMIAPTAIYQHVPAMSPEQVATLIARLIINKKPHFKPWWLYPVEILAVLYKAPLAYGVRHYYRYQARLKIKK